MYKNTRSLFAVMAFFTPFFAALSPNSPDKTTLVWIGFGIICALLSIMSAITARDEKQ